MYLVSLLYASTASEEFDSDDIKSILISARENNQKENITGILYFSRKYFLQCLEGSRTAVNNTYYKIMQDKRHKDILLIDYRDVTERCFDKWAMGYLPDSSKSQPSIKKFSTTDIFTPQQLSAQSARKLLIQLQKDIPVQ